LQVESALVELFDAEISLQRTLEENKLILLDFPNFKSSNCFKEVVLYSGNSKMIDK